MGNKMLKVDVLLRVPLTFAHSRGEDINMLAAKEPFRERRVEKSILNS